MATNRSPLTSQSQPTQGRRSGEGKARSYPWKSKDGGPFRSLTRSLPLTKYKPDPATPWEIGQPHARHSPAARPQPRSLHYHTSKAAPVLHSHWQPGPTAPVGPPGRETGSMPPPLLHGPKSPLIPQTRHHSSKCERQWGNKGLQGLAPTRLGLWWKCPQVVMPLSAVSIIPLPHTILSLPQQLPPKSAASCSETQISKQASQQDLPSIARTRLAKINWNIYSLSVTFLTEMQTSRSNQIQAL